VKEKDMITTEYLWDKDRSYVEGFARLHEGLGPVLRIRAVKTSEEEVFEPVVRDFKTGKMVASGWDLEYTGFKDCYHAYDRACRLASNFIRHNSNWTHSEHFMTQEEIESVDR
jgi:hypothetical protein